MNLHTRAKIILKLIENNVDSMVAGGTNMNNEKVKQELLNLIELDPLSMDDLIHDIFGRRASDLNNQGAEEQVAFLLYNGIFDSIEEIADYLKQS